MKTTSLSFWASTIALLGMGAPGVQAKPTATTASAASTTTEGPKCTASLITTLCDYADPFRAAASSGEEHCWGYCHENQPCDFVIFAAGNPYTGTGTCWVYPGETYDESKGTQEGCSNQYLSVFGKPECEGPSTTTEGACEATKSPSAIAEVCDYPPPDEECFYDCYASSGASNCLSICADADDCNYAVFNPRGETNSPYEPGTCWVYPEGKYDEDKAGTCGSDGPEQYVYKNVCPKPKSSKTSSSADASATSNSDDDKSNDDKSGDDESEEAQADGAKAGGSKAGGGGDDEEDAASLSATLSLTTLFGLGLAMLF